MKLVLLLLVAAPLVSQSSIPQPKPATAQEVCDFITKGMSSSLPQIPTLCVPKEGTPLNLELSVFSPTDVLEGKMRRAWSTALFLIFQKLYFGDYLGGICRTDMTDIKKMNEHPWGGCLILVSDSSLSQSGKQYTLQFVPTLGDNDPIHGDSATDEWYQRWWSELRGNPKFEHPGNDSNARSLAEGACNLYRSALQTDPIIIANPKTLPIPSCSVILATDSAVGILVSFSDSFNAMTVNYVLPLADTFGKTFANTPYRGAVILQGPWSQVNGETWRQNSLYELSDLTWLFAEGSSGVRPNYRFEALRHSSGGQTVLNKQIPGVGSGEIVSITNGPSGRTVHLIDGSAWFISPNTTVKSRLLWGAVSYIWFW